MDIVIIASVIFLTGFYCEELCGTTRQDKLANCYCYPSSGRILCANLNLHEVPSFVSQDHSYWYIDLQNNKITDVQPQTIKHFTAVDLRGNPLDCHRQILKQDIIKSDCRFSNMTVKDSLNVVIDNMESQKPESTSVTYSPDVDVNVNTDVNNALETIQSTEFYVVDETVKESDRNVPPIQPTIPYVVVDVNTDVRNALESENSFVTVVSEILEPSKTVAFTEDRSNISENSAMNVLSGDNTTSDSSIDSENTVQSRINLETLGLMCGIIFAIVILSVVTGLLTKQLIRIQGAVRSINLSEIPLMGDSTSTPQRHFIESTEISNLSQSDISPHVAVGVQTSFPGGLSDVSTQTPPQLKAKPRHVRHLDLSEGSTSASSQRTSVLTPDYISVSTGMTSKSVGQVTPPAVLDLSTELKLPYTQSVGTKGTPKSQTDCAHQVTPSNANDVPTQVTPCSTANLSTQITPAKFVSSGTQGSPSKGVDLATQVSPSKGVDLATQVSPSKGVDLATQVSPSKGEATQISPVKVTHVSSQVTPSKISPKLSLSTQVTPKLSLSTQVTPKLSLSSQVTPKQCAHSSSKKTPRRVLDFGSRVTPPSDYDPEVTPPIKVTDVLSQATPSKISPKLSLSSRVTPKQYAHSSSQRTPRRVLDFGSQVTPPSDYDPEVTPPIVYKSKNQPSTSRVKKTAFQKGNIPKPPPLPKTILPPFTMTLRSNRRKSDGNAGLKSKKK